MEATLEQFRDLSIQEVAMIINILGSQETMAYKISLEVIQKMGHRLPYTEGEEWDLAVAPLLTVKVSLEELHKPRLGTLIFHPSPLPYGRGASALKWAYRRHEPIAAACWFWANDKLDAGDICELEIIKIEYSMSPRAFYETHIIPALERTLKRCLEALDYGFIHRVPQEERYSTYDPKI